MGNSWPTSFAIKAWTTFLYNRSMARPDTRSRNFSSQHIAEFQWSPDGKTLAVARAQNTSDVVLLREK